MLTSADEIKMHEEVLARLDRMVAAFETISTAAIELAGTAKRINAHLEEAERKSRYHGGM